jgi:hypothetical protein
MDEECESAGTHAFRKKERYASRLEATPARESDPAKKKTKLKGNDAFAAPSNRRLLCTRKVKHEIRRKN